MKTGTTKRKQLSIPVICIFALRIQSVCPSTLFGVACQGASNCASSGRKREMGCDSTRFLFIQGSNRKEFQLTRNELKSQGLIQTYYLNIQTNIYSNQYLLVSLIFKHNSNVLNVNMSIAFSSPLDYLPQPRYWKTTHD